MFALFKLPFRIVQDAFRIVARAVTIVGTVVGMVARGILLLVAGFLVLLVVWYGGVSLLGLKLYMKTHPFIATLTKVGVLVVVLGGWFVFFPHEDRGGRVGVRDPKKPYAWGPW